MENEDNEKFILIKKAPANLRAELSFSVELSADLTDSTVQYGLIVSGQLNFRAFLSDTSQIIHSL